MIHIPESALNRVNSYTHDKSLGESNRHLQNNKQNGHTNFFYVYFIFSYYIGFTPFRFRFDSRNSAFTMHSWYPQKIFCAAVHVTVLVRYALEIKKVHHGLRQSDPITYFELIERSSSFLCKVVAFHHFWKKKNAFFKIITLLQTSSFPQYNPYKIHSTRCLSTICCFYIAVSIIRLLLDPDILNSYTLANNSWYRGLVIESRYSYLISTGKEQPIDNIYSVSALHKIMAALTAINILFRIMAGFYLDLCILICVISLWTPVVGYVNALNVSIEEMKCAEFSPGTKNSIDFAMKISESTVIQQFKQLKCLSSLICEAIGGFLIPAISEIAFGYAIDFEEVILTENSIRRFTNIIFYASTSSTLIFAAETCRKITCVKTWFCVNEKDLKISRNELMMILDNIAHDEICINAGGRVTINYPFVGTMVVVLVTFFIIRLQSELSSSSVPSP